MKKTKPVWKRAAPAKAKHHSLSPAKKAAAKKSAKRAGRPYPNLVDNMRTARKKKTSTSTAKTGKRKTTKHKTAKRKSSTHVSRKKT